jgi:hypothetical protein
MLGMIFGIVAVGALGLGLYAWWSAARFDERIDGLQAEMLGTSPGNAALPLLPEIVRAYALRAGGTVGGPMFFHATHKATLSTAKGQAPIAIDADQWTATAFSALVWRGRGAMLGLPVTVVDSFVSGTGLLEARVAGTIVVASGSGGAFDKGELQRYLSELPVYPDAILNNGALTWRQLDDTTVEVAANSREGPATARFSFDANGDIVGIVADDRPMTVGDAIVPTTWRGSYSRYGQIGSYRIPLYGEVGWELPDGLFTYWRGEVTSYEALPAPK